MKSISVEQLQTQWIRGRSTAAGGSGLMPVRDPADASLIAEVPQGSPFDAEAAIAAAKEAGPQWGALSPWARAGQLREAARRIGSCRDEVARLLTRENGKPLAQAYGELDYAYEMMNTVSELGVYLSARHAGSQAGDLMFQHWQPRGVAACISTWNYPIIASVEMAVYNLVVGNTVVLKSSEKTPLATRLLFEQIFEHLPVGVVNHLNGNGPNVGEPLVRHPDVDVVIFIGSIKVGRQIGRMAGERASKVILELGGKDAMIVDDTVDPISAGRLAAFNAFANTGQICTSTERIYVHRGVYDAFLQSLVRAARTLKVGPGLDPTTELGPIIDEAQLSNVERHVNSAVQAGAEVLTGGHRLNRPGFFYPPTVMANVTDDTPLMLDETYGPVAPVLPVDSFDEAIERANATEYGLAAIVCTESAPRAISAIDRLKTGTIKINCGRGMPPVAPGEPAKSSGLGIGRGPELLRDLTTLKAVQWRGRLA